MISTVNRAVEPVEETTISHFLPLVIFHPTNHKLQLVKVQVVLIGEFSELNKSSAKLYKLLNFKSLTWGEICDEILDCFKNVKRIKIRSIFSSNSAEMILR